MTKNCEEETTRTDLYTFLEILPTELGMLYERILGESNKKYQGQAALVLHILKRRGWISTGTRFVPSLELSGRKCISYDQEHG